MTYIPTNAVRGQRVAGRHAAYSKSGTGEGVVIAKHPTDAKENKSKVFTEYLVKELRTGQVYRCRRVVESYGVDDACELPLRPAQKSADQSTVNTGAFDPLASPLLSSDGDHVAIAFLQGSQDSAVILGVLPHTKSPYRSKAADKSRQYRIHKNTSVQTDDDGTYTIKRHLTPNAPGQPVADDENVTTVVIRPNGDIELNHASGATVHALEDGTLRVDGADSEGVRLGFSATEHVVRGDSFMQTFNALVARVNALNSAYAAHFHQDATTAPTSGPIDVPVFVVSAPPVTPTIVYSPGIPQDAVGSASDMPASDLSDKVVTE